MDIDIEGLDRAEVLAALYNAAAPLGMGFMQYDPALMTRDEAAALLERGNSKGRPLKVRITETHIERADLYDRDQGAGRAQWVVNRLLDAATTPEGEK